MTNDADQAKGKVFLVSELDISDVGPIKKPQPRIDPVAVSVALGERGIG
jgi:hypothetical protein